MHKNDVIRFVDPIPAISLRDAVSIAWRSLVDAVMLPWRHPFSILPLVLLCFAAGWIVKAPQAIDALWAGLGLSDAAAGTFGTVLLLMFSLAVLLAFALLNQTVLQALAGSELKPDYRQRLIAPNAMTWEVILAYLSILLKIVVWCIPFILAVLLAHFIYNLTATQLAWPQFEGFEESFAFFEPVWLVVMLVILARCLLFVPGVVFNGETSFDRTRGLVERRWKPVLLTAAILNAPMFTGYLPGFLTQFPGAAIAIALFQTVCTIAVMIAAYRYYRLLGGSINQAPSSIEAEGVAVSA